MSYKFGKTSLERLSTCDDRLQNLFMIAISRSPVDFGIAEGHRTIARQKKLYDEGKSKIDGVTRKGKHNYSPSRAVDVYAWVNGKASWDKKHLILIAGVVLACAKEARIDIRWGGNWDGDGEIISDQNFIDLPHYELI